VVLPKQALEGFMHDIVEQAKKSDIQLPLISGKLFGGDQRLLRFMGEGYAIAINFPRSNRSGKFAEFLDRKTLCYEGRPNLIKDSRLPREILEATYPETDEFRKQLKDFDPKRLVISEFSQRLGL
jgi:decaprenylphospho-beta-D-ribofuranose 2-oxidase